MLLLELPTETLLVVLEFVAGIDLPAFLRCQATSKKLHLLVHDILSSPRSPAARASGLDANKTASSPVQLQPLFVREFGPLFRSADCFTPSEREDMFFLTLEGDYTRPFKRLSWAKDVISREIFLRNEASWRNLSVTFGRGPPITQLDIVKSYSSEIFNEDGRDHIQYLQVDLAASTENGCLTMGLLYDLVLCGGWVGDNDMVTFGGETGSWELLLGRKLRSYDVLFEYECFIANDEDLVDRGPDAAQTAILYVQGGTVDGCDEDRLTGADDANDWEPEMLGQPPKLLPWQGPEPRRLHASSPGP